MYRSLLCSTRLFITALDAIDSGANKSAVVSCNKLLKKYPKSDLLKALKALALVRQQKVEEPIALCDEVLASKPTDESTLNAMMLTLRQLGRHNDTVIMFEDALKRQPQNEELALQTFYAYVRTGNWKSGQLLATKMSKQFAHNDNYPFWAAMCAVLQANDFSTPPAIREVLYKLAHRIIASAWKTLDGSAERLHLYLTVLRELKSHDEAMALLKSEQGRVICSRSLTCDEIRRDIVKASGAVQEEGEAAKARILEQGDRNWLEFLSVLDAHCPTSGEKPLPESVGQAREFFVKVAEKDGKKDRSGLLAQLELEKRARAHGIIDDSSRLLALLKCYLETFGDKAVCYEDLLPYVALDSEDLAQWTRHLQMLPPQTDSVQNIQRSINVHKLLRFNLAQSELAPNAEDARAMALIKQYFEALPLGSELPKTELQPADDLVILAAQIFVNAYHISQEDSYLHRAVIVLEYGLLKSAQSYKIRLLLIRIYRLLCAPQLALEHYRQLGIKQVQHDTMSHYVLSRASMFSLAASGDLTYVSECLEASQVYLSNSQEVKAGRYERHSTTTNTRKTADFIVRAFQGEKYSQIANFTEFEDRLDNSLARDLVKMEHVRMRITHEPINADLIDMEAIELKFIFDRAHHDNRDMQVIPNYQPASQGSFYAQTTILEKDPGHGWLNAFLKVYIKAFKLASDLDTTVEEKLLIGDRPKPSTTADSGASLVERLSELKQEELDELTPDELAFVRYATDLSNWLAPYHDFSRPPPAVVLAEANKQSELRAKGINPPASEAGVTNGAVKKEEDPPAIQEAPVSLIAFFDRMQDRFRQLVSSTAGLYELLHVATLAQEALILFTIETLRFKNASLVKMHKFGALVQSFKGIRARGLDVASEIGKELVKLGEAQCTAVKRAEIVDACKDLRMHSQLTHEYILDIAKKITDSRKKVLDGVGKGVKRIVQTHTS
ncbi:N-acetyltransferase B complex non catalytic subunit-domain-containing protein [Vararia minispora EC-137]|uniref:N-acetyltransferase B complex non catalytic subunit-domain-containing protein n=1 Tax=Vararia minispora EC-137 TaxID=1314806 RepID=A0ACB8QVS3_9AGAM|nr:N-acetyltransferase B complex non catalytic subunit-domain-containing protein [Vararia minispora EC-137]